MGSSRSDVFCGGFLIGACEISCVCVCVANVMYFTITARCGAPDEVYFTMASSLEFVKVSAVFDCAVFYEGRSIGCSDMMYFTMVFFSLELVNSSLYKSV